MGFIEQNTPFEIRTAPFKDLLEPGLAARCASQCGVRGEQDTCAEADFGLGFEFRQRMDIDANPAQGFPISYGITLERGVFGNPDMAAVAAEPLVHQDPGELPPLPCPRAVAEEKALAVDFALRVWHRIDALVRHDIAAGQIVFERVEGVDDGFELRGR